MGPRRGGWPVLLLALLLMLAGGTGCGTAHRIGPGLAGVGDLPAAASAWPAAGYDARHSSATTAVGPQHGSLRWRAQLAGDLTPAPVIGVDGSILAASHAGVLHALDPATGRQRWQYDGGAGYGTDLSTGPAVLAGGTILWPGPQHTLFALSATGTLLWRETFAAELLSPAVAGAHRVYVADLDGHLSALEVTATGHRRVWTLDLHGSDYASPTVGPDGTVYTASTDYLVAVRDLGDSGVQRWRYHAKSLIEVSNAVASDGTVVLGTNADREYGIRPDGSRAWSFDKGEYTYSSSVIRPDGKAYFGDNQGRLTVLQAATGNPLQRSQGTVAPRTASIWTAPAVDARGDYYYATQSGRVYGFDPGGRQLFDLDAGAAVNSYPAIGADGSLYLGTVDGSLLAISPR
ncbi:MAG: PQQ-binding-like beta-propeller repeat protein [Jatrophihabitans sp.]